MNDETFNTWFKIALFCILFVFVLLFLIHALGDVNYWFWRAATNQNISVIPL